MNYSELTTLIDAYVNRNGVQAITGQILNGVLNKMVEQLGRGYQIMGVASPPDDPGLPDGPECWFAGEPGTYTNFGGITVIDGEIALLCYDTGWTKRVFFDGFANVEATVDSSVGTPSASVSYADGTLTFTFSNLKGDQGNPAEVGDVTASVDNATGTPEVTVSTSGPDTAKNIDFAFKNLKGATGTPAGFGDVVATVDNNVGIPSVSVVASGPDTAKDINFAFKNLKGPQGVPGQAAGFGTVLATVDNVVGTPSVDIVSSGPDSSKDFTFLFHNLKGEKGDQGARGIQGERGPAGLISAEVTVDNNSGIPYATASVGDGVLSISFFNLKGEKGDQGNTGSSVDYPYELVNNRTTDDPTKGLSAAEGYRLGQDIEDLNLSVSGAYSVRKDFVWADGFVASGTVISSALSKFCQPVLFHAGEKLTYKTGSDYQSAVVQVADDTPIAVGSTGITVQVLINAPTANVQYEYTFETDMWVVISVLKSDYVLNTFIYRQGSISEQIDTIEEKVFPQYTNHPAVNASIDELYISGYRDGYYISYFYWTGTALTMIIRDSADNIVWFANGMAVTEGVLFELSQNGVTVYGILNSTTHLVSPVVAAIGGKALSLDENPQVSAKVLAPNVYYSPLCVSRFNLGTLPNADHNASWLGIVRRCDEVNDSVFCFANKMAPAVSNHFFDFYSVGTHARGVPYVAEMETYLDFSGKNGLSTSDALLMPLIVGAVENADGDNLTEKWFTGGNHAYGNTATGAPTLREVSNIVRVDGVLVPVGKGGVRGRVCTVDLVDMIQGYNTCKENGGGREIIQENVHIEVTNDYIETTVEFVALESVIVYGPMYASGMNVENMVGYRFIGSQTRRGLYVYDGGNVPGNDDNAINAISIHTADDYVFDTVLDLSYGQGNKLMYGSPNCIVTTSKKAYFVVIPTGTQVALDEGGSICYRTRMYFRKK